MPLPPPLERALAAAALVADGRYRVTFAGNGLTSRDRVEGYRLHRASELALADGHAIERSGGRRR